MAMNQLNFHPNTFAPSHSWLRLLHISFVPGEADAFFDQTVPRLLDKFRSYGHTITDTPQPNTDLILTTARFGEPLNWRKALLFTARSRFRLERTPVLYTLLHARSHQFQYLLHHFENALSKFPPDPQDFSFPGLADQAYLTLYEQGKRGGPMLSLLRLVQSQAKCIRIILFVGEDEPEEGYTFDLVGAHPRTPAQNPDYFYEDLMLRMVTAASTHEITAHQVVMDEVPAQIWQNLSTPAAMRRAGVELGRRNFFTEMVRIANLVNVPAVADSVASQYSEGCFATWDTTLNALIATITGSARPVDKDNLTDDELAVIVGVRSDGQGALVRHVQGKRNDPPSSEAVEMILMDRDLPRIRIKGEDGTNAEVPVARSKLHGHRGLRAFDPQQVEFVRLDEPFYSYPVSCSTEAQAQAIYSAFSRAASLQNPDDPRQVAFTILPGHGIVIVEKWVANKAPFQVIWEMMDSGALQMENAIPQGDFTFISTPDGRFHLHTTP
jgi:hypothetical protein